MSMAYDLAYECVRHAVENDLPAKCTVDHLCEICGALEWGSNEYSVEEQLKWAAKGMLREKRPPEFLEKVRNFLTDLG